MYYYMYINLCYYALSYVYVYCTIMYYTNGINTCASCALPSGRACAHQRGAPPMYCIT